MTRVARQVTSPEAMESIGAAVADRIEPGTVIFLSGDLGAGKTTLARGLLRGLGISGPVKSPTFTLIEPYPLARPGLTELFHLDLYRLEDPAEFDLLGADDFFNDHAVVLIEWPEQAAGHLPGPDLDIRLTHDGSARQLQASAGSARGERLLVALTTGCDEAVK